MPTGITCNNNGDVFVLDLGASCIHIVDRSTVAKVHIIGQYMKADSKPYSANLLGMKASGIKFSNYLNDITCSEDNISVVDAGRQEVIILRNCLLARDTPSRFVNVIKKVGVLSVSSTKKHLMSLAKKDSGYVVEITRLKLSDPKKDMPFSVSDKLVKRIEKL